MNWDQIEGNWKQANGDSKQKWGKLTDDDLDVSFQPPSHERWLKIAEKF